jgi:hypothetical protein
MVESLRGLGYSTATALADIIDNSISAHATRVDVWFRWQGRGSTVSVLDDGDGMDSEELECAMRLGGRSPLDVRPADDLGRFGLGLKTASFSQCRKLTVASRRGDEANCLAWNLDLLASQEGDGWLLQEGSDGELEVDAFLASDQQGTLVHWSVLDRVVTSGFTEQNFLDLVDGVDQHIAMVFHRYLEGQRPRMQIAINGKFVAPWSPFLVAHPATWTSPLEVLVTGSGVIKAQGHVLPHKDRLTPTEYTSAAGPDGWTAQQGFYVYRNERLLLAGSWLGLGIGRSWTKEEAHRLARIRLDIANTDDAEWKIDIRKSTARPPVTIRSRLTRLAEDTRERARRGFAHRGQVTRVNQVPLVQAWRADYFKGGMRYRLDEEHPAILAVLADAGPLEPQIRAMLRVIEETIPVQRIWLDTTESKETPRIGFADSPVTEVASVLEVMYRNLVVRKGMSPALAKERLLSTEPFQNFPELVARLPDVPKV